MSEGGVPRSVAADPYRSAGDSAQDRSGPVYPAVPVGAMPTQAMTFDQRYHPHMAAEMNTDMPIVDNPHSAPRVGDNVVHRASGQRGTVVGHTAHGYSGTAVPQVQWAGEDASWPQGVSANALRVEASTPADLYSATQDASSRRPLNRGTGAQ